MSPRSVKLPAPGPLLTRGGWSAFMVALLVVCAVAPVLNLMVPKDSAFHLSDYMVGLLGKIMCYAICALAMDLIWGYTGILSLGHGLFFALGGYVMGMYLMRQIGTDGHYKSELPDFMVFLDWKELPWHWALSDSFIATVLLIVLVPGLVAFVFGYFAFRSRIKGVYFSIITQALTFAAMLLFFRNETGFGGNNGFTDFKRILDIPIATQGMRMTLFVITGLTLLGFFLWAKWLVGSKFGRVLQAVRDAESRVMFCGYDPLPYKLTIWTVSAVMCGVAGALYVPQVGIINPGEMSPANSIEIAIWTAVGGRATLIGPIVGAFIVNGAKSVLTVNFPEYWLYFLGGLFIVVTLFMPQGVVGLVKKLKKEGSFTAGPPQGKTHPPGGQRPAQAAERGGDQS
ncbi:MAG TPA: urea ABC transporter permease subunit UrtC [Hydrogenophaga sp.]|uniref:urea ABC transporter permease subunit UrtC n=1 Tax=Hydrogenophaga sp. TaxID=1904254 RepID=UPI002C6A3F7B|nr:urea ABC transporter permease subunit UrtC [Hydrogenophaga sp.]HMN93864.1 urea ABC transporter permease subunit UrtC [Hydrogenophaga sp.]HMP11492.1 urea ABC transporter permease subunit UrtC [Hydrogenophaga sp.]